jgi:3-dehydrosphinganine reductase
MDSASSAALAAPAVSAAPPVARHAIITGGSSGIGKATAIQLARRGAHVTIMARRPDVLAAARLEIEAARRSPAQRIADLSVDVSDRQAVVDAVQRAGELAGPCDLLVTSAGIAEPGYFADLTDDTFERAMAVNYFGTLYAIRAVVPEMRANGGGRIVVVSSGAGIVGVFGYAAYSPTKFALRGLAESLRGELARDGIRVSIVYPPDTNTPQLAQEMATKPRETQAITAGAKIWSADGVATAIVKGVQKGRFAITPGWEMTALYWLHSAVLPLLNRQFDRVAARAAES